MKTKARPARQPSTTITITDQMAHDLDQIANKIGWSRSALIERCLAASVEAVERFDSAAYGEGRDGESLTMKVLDQLARTTLLPKDMSEAILAGEYRPLSEIVMSLVIGTIDAEAMTRNESTSTWNDRRIARQCLAVAFLSSLALATPQFPAEQPLENQL